ncbi:PP2C family protein-serine/threonine phosphatase [Spirosoma sp. KUDC1026]|uniref:PP2C family protein-serine/threonine phosphatase n=1 Tax=Spirosoma sp. KUDC1026 TaxID=2745947 RepID=UPI00159BEE94|nr:protein phosphatase 2C domain-containing protein [Spirosoma sp. KUDC1026]QKZ15104.1 serine/threonine-protein phosphatase [Spirosoma sp. KUDC1026]
MHTLTIAGQTDVGKRRQDNQDTFICTSLWAETSALLVVIDGVGGYAGGERASAIAKESIQQYMATPKGDTLTMLREALVFANNQIDAERQQHLELDQMCCVLTAAVADAAAEKVYYAHVGDTRLYRYRNDELEKITFDHSLVGEREDANELSEAEAMEHPHRNVVLRTVGSEPHRVDDEDFIESNETDFLPGDLLLLCSDGLTDMLTRSQIRGILNRPLSPEEQIRDLIQLANQQGGKDNITVVVARQSGEETGSITTGATSVPDKQPNPVVSASTTPMIASKPDVDDKGTSGSGRWGLGLGALVAIALIVALIWYQNQPDSRPPRPVAVDSIKISNEGIARVTGFTAVTPTDAAFTAADTLLDSLKLAAYGRTDHRLVLPADTFRLREPLLLTDSMLAVIGDGQLTVLMPIDSTKAALAVQINRSGAVRLENLVISGFKTGIEAASGGQLIAKKLYFADVEKPMLATVQQDSISNAVISLTVKESVVAPVKSKRSR